jgi:hypothetical protein
MNKKLPGLVLSFGLLVAGAAHADPDLMHCMGSTGSPPAIPADVAQASNAAYKSAYPVVLGRPATYTEAAASHTAIMVGTPTFDPKTCVAGYAGVSWEAPKFTDAVAVVRAKLLAPSNGLERAQVIDLAFYEALGRVSTQEEQIMWDTKLMKEKLTFAAIKSAQLAAVAQNNPERKAMLERAYQAAYGRSANAGDLGYWGPRKDQYVEVRKAQLAYLYGQGMQAELPGTVTRALTAKLGRMPSDQEAKTLLAKVMMSKKALYEDMLAMP